MTKPLSFTLENDPQTYTLTFDWNALCDAEAATGVNLLLAIGGIDISLFTARALLYGLLRPAHPLVTIQEAGALLVRDMDAVLAHMYNAIPHPEDKPTSPPDHNAQEAAQA